MKGLNEESIAQIDDVEKLRYLLTGVTQKNAKQVKRVRVLQRQLKTAKAEVHSLTESLTRLKVERESQSMFRWERDFEKIRADYNEFAFSQAFRLIQDQQFDNSDFFREQMQKYQNEFQRTQSSEVYELRNIIASKDDEIKTLREKLEALTNEVDAQQAEPISKDVEKAMLEKDQSILKLRGMIQKFVKSDQAKQQQIEEQQREIQRLVASITQGSPVVSREGSLEEVARLEREVESLKAQLTKSQASQHLERRCEKLSAMLDTSNQLYAELNGKYEALVRSRPKTLSMSPCECTELKAKSSEHGKASHSGEVEELHAMLASLRKTILQYFLTDLTNQENLIPVILELVGCTKEQIQAAASKFKSNQQFVNRAGSFLGLFT